MTPHPPVSVIVPTHGRPEALATCLAALVKQSYPRERMEIVVVDDGGPDGDAVRRAVAGHGARVRLLRQPRAGPASARNAGASIATGDAFAFTDDDCAPAPEWIAELIDRWRAAPDCLIGGATVNDLTGNVYAAASQTLIDYLYEYFNRDARDGQFFTSNNMLVCADRFERLGGFSDAFRDAAAEDRDFCDRWCRAGWRLLPAPLAVVRHAHAMTLQSFVLQHLRYGRGAAIYHRERAARGSVPVKLEPLSFYVGMVGSAFQRAGGVDACWTAMLLALSQLAGGVGYYAERWSARRVAASTVDPAAAAKPGDLSS